MQSRKEKSMMKNEIVSYCGVGEIQFGMSEAEIFRICENNLDKVEDEYPDEYKLFWKGKGISIICNGEGECVAIEGNILSKINYKGVELIGKPYKEVRDFLLQFGKEIVENKYGCTIFDLGIGLYVPTLKDGDSEKVEGVIAFVKDYYN